MSDRTLVTLARSVSVAGAVMVVAGVTVVFAGTDYSEPPWTDGSGLMAMLAVFFAAFVWPVIPQQPRNGAVWSMVVSAFFSGLYLAGFAAAALVVEDASAVLGSELIPASLPTVASLLTMAAIAGVYIALYSWLTFGMLLFPDGRLPAQRWRWVLWMAALGMTMMVADAVWAHRPSNQSVVTENSALINTGAALATLAVVLSVVGLIVRFRRSSGATRDQFKWVVWGAAILAPWFVAAFIFGGTEHENVVLVPLHIAAALMLGAYGVAVGKYRLFDVDVVISRTVVYGALAAFITGVYVVAVVGAGQLLGGGSEPNPALALAATVAVAVAFQPLRRRLQRGANRLVYGKNATPYEVLSQFSQRVAAADTALLDRVARSLVEGTGARRADVRVAVGDRLERAAAWPDGDGSPTEDAAVFPIEQGGVALGTLTLASRPGQRLSTEDQRLAREVASGMALALRNQQLTGALRTRVDELEVSRRRLVGVQDETRRKLERDLHDGAQQQLVALKVKLGLAQAIAERSAGVRTAALLRQLAGEADTSIDALRDFARGVYPPLLEAEGLATAISTQAQRLPTPIAVEADGIGRYDAQIEATIYFCVVEALQNIAKHAAASEATVRLADHDGTVSFEIADDGAGFDPATAIQGAGLANMRDRVEAAGGTFTLESKPGTGTRLLGAIPVR